MLQDLLTVLRGKTRSWLNQDNSPSAQPLRDAPVGPTATVVMGNSLNYGAVVLRNGNGLSNARREFDDHEIPNLNRHTIAPLGEPPSCLRFPTAAQGRCPDALQWTLENMHLVRSDARTICNADNDTLVRPSAAPQNQRAVQLPSGSAVCDEDEVVPSPSQATQEPIGLSDLEHYLHDLPWHTLSSSVEDDETQSKKKTATINCTKELFDIVLGPRGHRLRLIQRRSRVQITPDPSKPCFKLYGHPPNIEKVKNFVDILLARLRVVGNSYVIVRLGGPSVRSKLEALSSKFAGLANTVQEHDIHFTVTKFTSSITLNEMHAARNVIQAIIPDIQALATPVVLDELAYKKEYSRFMLGVQPRPGSPFHQIYELIHEALNDAHIPHSHESTLHVTVLKRKNRIDEAEKERRDKLLLSLDPVDILGPVVPVSIIISQERESYCYGSDYHISWATIPI